MTTDAARCPKCFQPLDPGAKFCRRCGSEVNAASSPAQLAASSISGTECPSCHHRNEHSARFCERCGTQLQAMGQPGGGPMADVGQTGAHSHTAEPEDPWATGPNYRPLRADETCPRCGNFRDPTETTCANCGLPFGQQPNYAGVPPTVAMEGEPAGFWIRFVAAIVDGIIVTLISLPFAVVSVVVGGSASTFLDLVQFAVSLLYAPVLLSMYGTTPGKKLFNIYILDATGNRKLNFGRAFIREISKFLSALILFIGYIMAGFRRDKRALHDLVAGTYPTVR